MDNWEKKNVFGGCSWTKATPPKAEIFVILDRDGIWEAIYLRPSALLEHNSFSGQTGDRDGLRRCLAWVRQKLASQGDPEFDEAEAERFLLAAK